MSQDRLALHRMQRALAAIELSVDDLEIRERIIVLNAALRRALDDLTTAQRAAEA